jgi:pimeloyl-ACP methyl ester carboxylesterase
MTNLETQSFTAADGARLAWYELGEGRPALLLHGLFSDAFTNWIRFGHADAIVAAGRRVIMMDFRAHGRSDKPHDPARYPPDILAADAAALVAHLDLRDWALVGYSLGARTAVRMVARSAKPSRLVLAGMGLEGLSGWRRRGDHFRHVLSNLGKHERGSPAWLAEAFLKTTKGDPKALLPLLDSFVDASADDLDRITMPTLVVAGADDRDNGSAPALAERLSDAHYVEVPGGHMSSVTQPELGTAIARFLTA